MKNICKGLVILARDNIVIYAKCCLLLSVIFIRSYCLIFELNQRKS